MKRNSQNILVLNYKQCIVKTESNETKRSKSETMLVVVPIRIALIEVCS
jgi:hypothetical protein